MATTNKSIYRLTKSKMLSLKQCTKKLYLDVYRKDLIQEDPGLQRIFDQGHQVGNVARSLYGEGPTLEISEGAAKVVEQTRKLIAEGYRGPIYEAAFLHDEVLVLADVVLVSNNGLRVIEVKSSTQVKDINLFDCAVQYWVMKGAGYKSLDIALAHIDTGFIYKGDKSYRGLLKEVSVLNEVLGLQSDIPSMVRTAKVVLDGPEPVVRMSAHCDSPYECGFQHYCERPQPEFPVKILPRVGQLRWKLADEGITDLMKVPDGRLKSPVHIMVAKASSEKSSWLNPGVAPILRGLPYPRYYLDFETIQFAVPIWKGTRPYEQLPFQWSCKIEGRSGETTAVNFLDLTGEAPMRSCAEQLLKTLGVGGPIVVYSGFEKKVISNLADRYSDLSVALKALIPRLYDLLPIAREHYYDYRMMGSWSIKKVLPTVCDDLDYNKLGSVRDGGAAQSAYHEAIQTADPKIKESLRIDMVSYCEQDAEAMVRTMRFLSKENSV